jgi:hypothetical protein
MGGRGKKELTGRAAAEETLEARICRETYNKETKKSKGSTSEPSSSVEQIDEDETVEFPTPGTRHATRPHVRVAPASDRPAFLCGCRDSGSGLHQHRLLQRSVRRQRSGHGHECCRAHELD